LASFIEARANSSDYREKLGIMAMVRRDFEKLTEMLVTIQTESESELGELIKRGELAIATANDLSLSEVIALRDNLPKVERIILYIDDLDRCKEDKVLEVLQAVHLLLAYKLFGVVVAVDSRWIAVSLEQSHSQLYGRSAQNTEIETPHSHKVNTTAADYLEKIFQVTYWVPEFDDESSKSMMKALFANEVIEDQPQLVASEQEIKQPAPGTDSDGVDFLWHSVDFSGQQHQQNESSVETDDRELPLERQLKPANLQTTKAESEMLIGVAPLAGRTPRQVKRFANLYRLLKARFGDKDLNAFLNDTNQQRPGFYGAIVLLAIVTGAPTAVKVFFVVIKASSSVDTVGQWADKQSKEPAGDARLLDVGLQLQKTHDRLQQVTLGELAQWTDLIGRFSFEGGQ
jgi:hypothetical protein